MPHSCSRRLGLGLKKGILPVWLNTERSVKVLLERGLLRQVFVDDGLPYNGVTLTQAGAAALDPPGTVTYPE
jgi:hypothetical protein